MPDPGSWSGRATVSAVPSPACRQILSDFSRGPTLKVGSGLLLGVNLQLSQSLGGLHYTLNSGNCPGTSPADVSDHK